MVKENGGFPRPLPVELKFDESKYLAEVQDYVAATYDQHYAVGNTQAFELIVSAGHGEGFCFGSIQKYASRYGKKGGYNRKDILKIIHYGLLALYLHDKEKNDGKTSGC